MAHEAAVSLMARRHDMAVKVDAEIVRKAKIVAAFKDVSLAEYLSEALRPIVDRELREFSQRSLDVKPEPKPAPKPKGKG